MSTQIVEDTIQINKNGDIASFQLPEGASDYTVTRTSDGATISTELRDGFVLFSARGGKKYQVCVEIRNQPCQYGTLDLR